jgi:predicted RNase H-like nuclease (RuvC/YqgF family)
MERLRDQHSAAKTQLGDVQSLRADHAKLSQTSAEQERELAGLKERLAEFVAHTRTHTHKSSRDCQLKRFCFFQIPRAAAHQRVGCQ